VAGFVRQPFSRSLPPLKFGSLGFKRVNDLRVQAPALLFGGSLHRLVDFFGHVLERDVHGTILEPLEAVCKGRPYEKEAAKIV
jgi:hypothetical protein